MENRGLDLTAARESIRGAVQEQAGKAVQLPDGFVPRSVTINVSYVDPEGTQHHASLTNTILGGDDTINQGRLATKLAGGFAWEMLPPITQRRIFTLSWLTFSLGKIPAWLNRWMVEDDVLRDRLYAEVERHEALYFRGRTETGEIAPVESRLQLDSSLPAPGADKRAGADRMEPRPG